MTPEEKQLLADSYANAWNAVKGMTATVEPLPAGWFEINYNRYGMRPRKVRAFDLLRGMTVLTARLLAKTQGATA